jgi:hypothetical protein
MQTDYVRLSRVFSSLMSRLRFNPALKQVRYELAEQSSPTVCHIERFQGCRYRTISR